MSATNDGGPVESFEEAMARADAAEAERMRNPSISAATLRDYFAAAALTGLLAGMESEDKNGRWTHEQIRSQVSSEAFAIADAMIAARGGSDGR